MEICSRIQGKYKPSLIITIFYQNHLKVDQKYFRLKLTKSLDFY